MIERPHSWVQSARTLLFVPGDRPDRFDKALASGADGIVLDLEDSVAAAAKPEARRHVREWFEHGRTGVVRINGSGTPWQHDDLNALGGLCDTVMLPKATSPTQITDLLARLSDHAAVLPILETAAGVLDARQLCGVPGVVRAVFGNGDLALELGIDHRDRAALAYARSAVVLASAAAGIASPLDGVTTSLDDDEVLTADTEHAAALGFSGKLCIHPNQVPIVQRRFTPSHDDIQWARRVVSAAADGAATAMDGEMIDQALLERARRLLSTGDH